MSGRRAVIAAVIVIGALIAVFAWKSRGGHGAAAPPQASEAPPPGAVAGSSTAVAPAAPAVPVATTAAEAPGSDEPRPQPVPLPEGAKPPALDAKHSEPAPAQKAFSPAETIAKREADLKMLDDTKARLEQDLTAAKAANDATAVHDLEIRIARLGDLRKKRSAELEQMRGSAQ